MNNEDVPVVPVVNNFNDRDNLQLDADMATRNAVGEALRHLRHDTCPYKDVVQNMDFAQICVYISQDWIDQMYRYRDNLDFLYMVISVAAVGDLDWFGAVREPDVMMDLHNSYYINGVAVAPY